MKKITPVFRTIKSHKKADEGITMADICELAHELTVRECNIKEITYDKYDRRGDMSYTAKAQKIFDYYYDLITRTLNL